MTDTKAAVEAATAPATFNFAEAVLDRSYPEFDVPVYLDEASVQTLVENNAERLALEEAIARAGSDKTPVEYAKKLEKHQKKYDDAVEALKADEYIVKIRGMAPEQQMALEEVAYDLFPKEFEESQSPVTGAKTRVEIPNDKRDEEFALLLRQGHIVSVTAPNGAIDADWSDKEKVRATFARLPYVSRVKIDEAIQNCTIAVDFYRELVDEVF